MREYHLALGSNLGDRIKFLRSAVEELRQIGEVTAISPVYETDPRYVLDQPPFLNLALTCFSPADPASLLGDCKRIEQKLGREEGIRYGPRVIDVDILLAGELVHESEILSIPHRLMQERAFVLVPLSDIAPRTIHPLLEESITEMKKKLTDLDSVKFYSPSLF